jgi:hypothetical protein
MRKRAAAQRQKGAPTLAASAAFLDQKIPWGFGPIA